MSKKLLLKLDKVLQQKKLTDAGLIKAVHELANSNDPKPRTVLSRYSHFKKYIRTHYPKYSDSTLKKMKAPDEMIDAIIQDNSEVRSRKKSVSFSDKTIEDLMNLEASSNIIDKLNFLTFTSGRRQSEVVDGIFHKVARKPDMLSVRGLKKKREADGVKPRAYKIKLFRITSTEWIKLHKAVMKALDGLSVADLNKRQNSRIKKTVCKDYTVHVLRGIYAHALWQETDRKQNINGYIQTVLNHDSPDTSLNYSYIIYDGDKDDGDKDDEKESETLD